jgi:hypothetical protein
MLNWLFGKGFRSAGRSSVMPLTVPPNAVGFFQMEWISWLAVFCFVLFWDGWMDTFWVLFGGYDG